MNTAITLDVTHLIVAAVAVLGPILLRRLQGLATPSAPATPAPIVVPTVPPGVAALLPLHGAVLNLLLQLLQQQQAAQPAQAPR
jgi:hypothetical protein